MWSNPVCDKTALLCVSLRFRLDQQQSLIWLPSKVRSADDLPSCGASNSYLLLLVGTPTTTNAAGTRPYMLVPSNALMVILFLGLNCSLNVLNKWALGVHGFTFPLLLTTCHMMFNFCILIYPMLREPSRGKHKPTLVKQWKGVVAVGICMAANVALNNMSLVYISLSLNQVIR